MPQEVQRVLNKLPEKHELNKTRIWYNQEQLSPCLKGYRMIAFLWVHFSRWACPRYREMQRRVAVLSKLIARASRTLQSGRREINHLPPDEGALEWPLWAGGFEAVSRVGAAKVNRRAWFTKYMIDKPSIPWMYLQNLNFNLTNFESFLQKQLSKYITDYYMKQIIVKTSDHFLSWHDNSDCNSSDVRLVPSTAPSPAHVRVHVRRSVLSSIPSSGSHLSPSPGRVDGAVGPIPKYTLRPTLQTGPITVPNPLCSLWPKGGMWPKQGHPQLHSLAWGTEAEEGQGEKWGFPWGGRAGGGATEDTATSAPP